MPQSSISSNPKRWNGETKKNEHGEPQYVRYGRVISANEHTLCIDTGNQSPGDQRLVHLQGEFYIFVCQACEVSITQLQADEAQMKPNRAEERCPMCQAQKSLRFVKVGERVKLHFRYGNDWGQWVGEVVSE